MKISPYMAFAKKSFLQKKRIPTGTLDGDS